MGLLGNEIIQSRTWVDPNQSSPPSEDYKHVFPITVFDAVRESMADENSRTLTYALEEIRASIEKRQTVIPERPANYLVTYGGEEGAVGAIEYTTSFNEDPAAFTDAKIPTEKAVAAYIQQLIDAGIDVKSVDWEEIVNRPEVYQELGDDDFGYISQAAMTAIVNAVNEEIATLKDDTRVEELGEKVDAHIANVENPHQVTAVQVGAVETDTYDTKMAEVDAALATAAEHAANVENPHGVTTEQIGAVATDSYDAKMTEIDTALTTAAEHAADQNNPHNVTVEQIGAVDATVFNGMVEQLTPTITAAVKHMANKENPHAVTAVQVGAVEQTAYDEKMATVDAHLTDQENPHGVTAEQVGAVDLKTFNGMVTQLTPTITSAVQHMANKANPHGVTAAQVGAVETATYEAKITELEGEIDSLMTSIEEKATTEALTAAEGKITALEATVGTAEAGLVKDVADVQAAVATKAEATAVETLAASIETKADKVAVDGLTEEGNYSDCFCRDQG